MKSVKVIGLYLMVIGLAAVFVFSGSVAMAAGKTYTLSAGFGSPPDFLVPYYYMKIFKEKVEDYSQGELKIKLFHSGSLCSETGCVEQMQQGALDIAELSTENYSAFHDTFLVYDLPYLFKNREHARRAALGVAFDELKEKSEKKDKVKCLGIASTYGFRNLYQNAREVRVPADMKGLKIRVTQSPIPALLTKGWGAAALNVPWPEVYQAAQTKVIHGNWQPTGWMYASKLYEVMDYCTECGPTYNFIIFVMSLKKYNNLPKHLQLILDQAAKESNEEIWEYDKAEAKKYKAKLQKLGVKYYTPTPAEMELWRTPGLKVLEKFKSMVDPQIFQLIESMGKNIK